MSQKQKLGVVLGILCNALLQVSGVMDDAKSQPKSLVTSSVPNATSNAKLFAPITEIGAAQRDTILV